MDQMVVVVMHLQEVWVQKDRALGGGAEDLTVSLRSVRVVVEVLDKLEKRTTLQLLGETVSLLR